MVDRTTRPVVPASHPDEREHRRLLAERASAALPKDGTEGMSAPLPMASYAVADLPLASLNEGAVAYDTDSDTPTYSDGSNWLPLASQDYAEGLVTYGTWTPTLLFGGSATGWTLSISGGLYTKVGRLVFVTFGLVTSAAGSSTGDCSIGVLPFTSASNALFVGSADLDGGVAATITGGTHLVLNVSSTALALRQSGTGDSTPITHTSFDASSSLFGSMTYMTD